MPAELSYDVGSKYGAQLRELLARDNYFRALSERRHDVSFRVVSLKRNFSAKDLAHRIAGDSKSRFVFFIEGPLSGGQLRTLFSSGHTLSWHNTHTGGAIEQAKERVLDELFFLEMLHAPGIGQHSLLTILEPKSMQLAVSVVDRSFRCLYRNDEHKRMAPSSSDGLYKLCWQEFRHLYDQDCPCYGCPTKALFDPDAKSIPETTFMVLPCGAKRLLCTRLQVFPVFDRRRNRVVASIEMAKRIDPKNIPESVASTLLQKTLQELTTMGYTRSRVFAYWEKTASLFGFKSYSVYREGEIPGKFENIILPFDKHDRVVFIHKKGIIRRYPSKGFKEYIFANILQKKRARVWLEFPLIRRGKILGKLVVDRFEPTGRGDKGIPQTEVKRLQPFADFVADLLVNVRFSESIEISEHLSNCTQELLPELGKTASKDEVLSILVKRLAECMREHIWIAFIREPRNPGKQTFLVLTQHISDPSVSKCIKHHSVRADKGEHISAVAYQTGRAVALPLSDEEKHLLGQHFRPGVSIEPLSLAKCSIPIVYRDQVLYILGVQGSESLMKPEVISHLVQIAKAAGVYCSGGPDKPREILVLGPESGGRLDQIKMMIDDMHGYRAVLARSRRDIGEYSVENKVRMLADQCRFVIIEDSIAAGQVVECKMCAANRILTAILREKGKTSTIMQRGYSVDYRFIREYEYETDPLSPYSLKETINRAIRWAEGQIEVRRRKFSDLYPYRE